MRSGTRPHLICVPETLVDEDNFVADIQDAYTRYGYAVAVVSENARSADGIIGAKSDPWFVDDFGHEYYDGPARYLAALVSRSLGVRARHEKPGDHPALSRLGPPPSLMSAKPRWSAEPP